MTDDGALEDALAAAERAAATCLQAQTRLQAELRRAQKAAQTGEVRDLRRAVAATRSQWQDLGAELSALEAAYDVDEAEYLAGGGYVAELLGRARHAGVTVVPDPDAADRLLSYPSVVRVLPGDAAVEVDKRRDRRLRPSVVVARLAKAQQQPPRGRTEPFLESLCGAYDLVIARDGRDPGSVVKLETLWAVLTLLPGARGDYGRPEFARDLYRLDQSQVIRARNGARLRFAASTGTRGAGVLTTVAQGGQQRRYWGVAFDPAGPA